ncbi:MAG: DUF3857 domain-containing protein [Vulcanimicrobiota bacterium]
MKRNKQQILLFLVVFIMSWGVASAQNQNVPVLNKSESAVILDDYIEYTVNNDGSTSLVEHELISILNQVGRNRYAKVIRTCLKPDQDVEVEIARIIKPDGTKVDLKPGNIVKEARLAEKSPALKDLVLLTIDFEDAQVGDSIEFRLKYTNKKPVVDNFYWSISYTNDEVPMEKTRFVVKMFKDADKLKWYGANMEEKNSQPGITELDGGKQFEWNLADRKPIVMEPSSPSRMNYTGYIMVSTCPGWNELSESYYAFLDQYIKPDENINEVVREITKNRETDTEKIQAILDFINQKESLELGFSADDLMIIPAREMIGAQVLSETQINLLLISMLKSAGIEAYPVLLANNKFGEVHPQLATPYQFNQLVSYINVNGEWHYVDGASPLNKSLGLHLGQQGRDSLVLRPGGAELAVTPVSSAEENLERITVQAQLAKDGSLGVNMDLIEKGTKQVFWEAFLDAMKNPLSKRAVFAKLISVISEDAKLLGVSQNEDPKIDRLEFEVSFMVEKYPNVSGDYWIVKLPIIPAQKTQFQVDREAERNYPVSLSNTTREEKRIELEIPPGFEITSMPSNLDIANDVGTLKVEVARQENTIIYDYLFQVDQLEVPPEKFAELKELYDKAFETTREVILIKKPSDNERPTS